MYFKISILLCFWVQFLHGFIHHEFNKFKANYFALSVSSIMPPADLTPAVDKFPSLPSLLKPLSDSTSSSSIISVTSRGRAPDGPEPFSYVANDVQPLADYVKELVKSENPVLTMAASHFFEQVHRHIKI